MLKKDEKLLTEVELELMGLLWRLGEGSVADVMAQLPADRELAYTSVSTILRILEQKQILTTRKLGRGHIYVPRLSRHDYEARALRQVVSKVFDNTPVALVRQLLNSAELSDAELDEIKKLIGDQKRSV